MPGLIFRYLHQVRIVENIVVDPPQALNLLILPFPSEVVFCF